MHVKFWKKTSNEMCQGALQREIAGQRTNVSGFVWNFGFLSQTDQFRHPDPDLRIVADASVPFLQK